MLQPQPEKESDPDTDKNKKEEKKEKQDPEPEPKTPCPKKPDMEEMPENRGLLSYPKKPDTIKLCPKFSGTNKNSTNNNNNKKQQQKVLSTSTVQQPDKFAQDVAVKDFQNSSNADTAASLAAAEVKKIQTTSGQKKLKMIRMKLTLCTRF